MGVGLAETLVGFSGSSTSKMKGSFTHMMLHMKVSTKRGLNDVWRLQ